MAEEARAQVITGRSWEPEPADDERRLGAGGVRVRDDHHFFFVPITIRLALLTALLRAAGTGAGRMITCG
jgi:hypothetical protein